MLTGHPIVEKAKSRDLVAAFVAGAPKDAEGMVFYGVAPGPTMRAWDAAKTHGVPWFYIDNSYFDATRGERFRVTCNRLQVRASSLTSDGKRFAALGLEIQPERQDGDFWLICMQGDQFMVEIARAPDWFERAKAAIPKDGREIVVREWNRDKAAAASTLPQALSRAWAVVTHSSAAAVTAALHGVHIHVSPTHALHGMAMSQRQPFLEVLADHEFTRDELRSGFAWEMVQRQVRAAA